MYFIEIEDDDDDGCGTAHDYDGIKNDRSIPTRQDSFDDETVTSTRNVYYEEGNEISPAMPSKGESRNITIIKNTHNVYYEAYKYEKV